MKKIFIERQNTLLKIAIKNEDTLKECFVEQETNSPKVGDIYKGVIKNIITATHGAFVDIGYEKNSYMSLDGRLKDNTLKKGDEVLVEIVKEEMGKKGPKVTRNISIPGSYAVLTKEHNNLEISKKIQDTEFIELIKRNISKPEDIGIVIRTKAEHIDINFLVDEVNELIHIYKDILSKFTYSSKVGPLYEDNGILSRVMRNYTDGGAMIIVDNNSDYVYYKQLIESKGLKDIQLELYKGSLSIFDNYGIEKEILALIHNKIVLPSGGNIAIDRTEAMNVVDVNTAKNIKSTPKDNTIFTTNSEAAKEIVRQIKLRNLGGIILVDFVNMKSIGEKKQIISILNEEFSDDKNNPRVYPFTELNLVQITRKKYGKSICDYLFKTCDNCRGQGEKVALEYLLNIIKGKIKKIKVEQGVKNVYLEMDAAYEKEIKNDILWFAAKLDALDCDIFINFQENLEKFKVESIIFHSQVESIKSLHVFKAIEN